MKIVIINGSPRREGNISRMLEAVAEGAAEAGHEISCWRVADMKFSPCRGCMKCRAAGECSLPIDDVQRLLDDMREAGAIVVGSPCYLSTVPGQLKAVFDRMVYGMADTNRGLRPVPLMKGKKGVIIATSTAPFPWNRLFHMTSGVATAIRRIFSFAGIRPVRTIQAGGTAARPVSDRTLAACRRIFAE